jgi:hypothetical protein
MASQINLDLLWAESGAKTDPLDAKYALGWIEEIPTLQNFNFLLNALDNNTLYLAENGKYNWQTEILYQVGAMVKDAGVDYYCHTSNVSNQPSTDLTGSFWTLGSLVGTGSLLAKEGLAVKNVNTRSANSWEGSDLTIENENALISLRTNNVFTKNLLLGNITGEAVVVDVNTTITPDDRNIALDSAGVYRIYHEGNQPPHPTTTTETEEQTLTDGQLSVVFATTNTAGSDFYVYGDNSDNGRLGAEDYAIVSSTTITLSQSYPSGTKVVVRARVQV